MKKKVKHAWVAISDDGTVLQWFDRRSRAENYVSKRPGTHVELLSLLVAAPP